MKEKLLIFLESRWFLRILSVAFAVTIWLYVNESKRTIVSMEIPLNFVNLPSDMMIVKVSTSTVNIRVSGAKRLLESLYAFKPRAEVDLRGVVEGVNLVSITPDYIKVPSYAEVTLISPSLIEVEVERIITKKIEVNFIPAEQSPFYDVTVVQCSPCKVELKGPRNAVQDKNKLTIYFKVKEWKEGIYHTLLKPSPDIMNTEVNPSKIELKYRVEKKKEVKSYDSVPVQKAGFKRVYPRRVKVVLKGWNKLLENLNENEIKVIIDKKSIKNGKANLKIEVPDDIEVLKVEPSRVKVF